MTALAGFWSVDGRRVDVDRYCSSMLQAQQIYGPGDKAAVQWSDGHTAMGRRLFKLLPEDRHDRGPIVGASGRVLVADIRLDNRGELLSTLGIDASDGRILPDAAVLMAAIERWDIDAIGRLRGDFAFALWDGRDRRLILARDYLGQRPLHFHHNEGFVAFASMPKGLHALPELPRSPDRDSLARFLALMPETGSRSFFEGVERVEPGHVQIFTPSGRSSSLYWQPARTLLKLKRDEDYVEAVRESLDRAVAARLRGADGRVGTHLSGGLDSSGVAATAARLVSPGSKIAAFTSVPGKNYDGQAPFGSFGDEGPHAASVAALYPNMEHVLIRTAGESPYSALDRNFFLYERPALNLCNGLWSNAIFKAAKQRGLKVMLIGTAGNMSFSYAGFERLPELLAAGRLVPLASNILILRRNGVRLKTSLAQAIGHFLPGSVWQAINRWRGRYFQLSDYSIVNLNAVANFRAEAEAAGLDFSYRPRRDPFGTRVWALRRVDPGNYNKGYLGGWGIDVRDPTADQSLVELCLSIPAGQFLKDGVPRSLARRVLADRVPATVVEERRKGLQAIDWHEGVCAAHEEVRKEVERIMAVDGAARLVDSEKLNSLVEDWPTSGWTSDKVTKNYRLALLRGVSGGHFLRQAAGSNA
ncbi:MAG: asparagine synthetase B family protein [Allosphingosinicella sp.]